ncbi:Glycosyltransferase involved in cell wall bisynthesis [Cyclobacterium lianum]|uniref:Glycosyltransferase involved in cell wall bisynthesis n=1 Tax=Cyclobacterium lianum TaxID=388280 RepID=A0A1M7JVD5_9BACT|nr:glycosyltransferase family 1 protein [Cyclobacterium lianum]SHM56871.1 Glycosyltransferase involved in cell wall bisynthesis [Cyclobacterium lianum]
MIKGRQKIVLIDVFFLHLAQTGIKTYIDSLLDQIEADRSSTFRFVVYPSREKLQQQRFFKGKTPRWKNWLFQLLYFSHKLVFLPVLSYWHRADLVFSPDFLSPVWSRGERVSVVHDAFFWESPEHYHPLWRKIYLYLLSKSIRRGTHILTVSHYAKDKISRYLNPVGPVCAIPTGLDFSNELQTKAGPSPLDKPYFLHVGVMEKRKNLVTLIRAFAIFSQRSATDFSLVLVGQRAPRASLDDYDEIWGQVKALGMEEKVIFPGYLSQAMLSAYYAHALAYVFPSQNEGFGLPVLESFAYGLPVIIGPQGALQEVGGNAVCCSRSFTPEDFATAMELLAGNEELRQQLVARGRERLQQFSGENFFLSLQRYFKNILYG